MQMDGPLDFLPLWGLLLATVLIVLLSEPHRKEIRDLLRQYLDVRIEAASSGQVEQAIRRSEELQGQLWAQAETVAEKKSGSIMVGLFVQSLNEMIDVHSKRVMVA